MVIFDKKDQKELSLTELKKKIAQAESNVKK